MLQFRGVCAVMAKLRPSVALVQTARTATNNAATEPFIFIAFFNDMNMNMTYHT